MNLTQKLSESKVDLDLNTQIQFSNRLRFVLESRSRFIRDLLPSPPDNAQR